MSFSIGSLALAYALMGIPLVITALLLGVALYRRAYYRRYSGLRRLWEQWLSSLLIGAVLCAGFYWYLFAGSFYGVTVQQDRSLLLHYELPQRHVQLPAGSVAALERVDERVWLARGRPRQRLVVVSRDGSSHQSALERADALATIHAPLALALELP